MSVRSILPFLMFQGDAGEALAFYTALFEDSRIDGIEHYGADAPGMEGKVRLARFTLAGQKSRRSHWTINRNLLVHHEFSYFHIALGLVSNERTNRHTSTLACRAA